MTETVTKKLTTKQRKAIAIAKDCKAQILQHAYQLLTGNGYVLVRGVSTQGSVQKALCEDELNCEVCGLGALLLSSVRLYNKLDFRSFSEHGWKPSCRYLSGNDTFEVLKQYFTLREMALIEGVFENGIRNHRHVYNPSKYQGWNQFDERVERYRKLLLNRKLKVEMEEEEKILLGICNNIIKNKGRFILPELPKGHRLLELN